MASATRLPEPTSPIRQFLKVMKEYQPLLKPAAGDFKPFKERLPTSDPALGPIEIPVVATPAFIGSECLWKSEYTFDKYPRQLGLDQDRLMSGDFSELPPFLMLAVLQQWLYFAFVEAVTGFPLDWFNAIGFNERNELIVNTEAYRDPVSQWFYWLGYKYTSMFLLLGPGYNEDDPYQRRMETSLQHLTFVRDFVTRFQPQFYTLCPPVGAVVHLSVLMLGERLQAARDRVPDIVMTIASSLSVFESTESWGPAPVLEERLLQANWCPGEVKRLCAGMNVCNQYFAGFLPRSKEKAHDGCSSELCIANQITDTFTGKHTPWCQPMLSGCEPIGPSQTEVVEVLKGGSFPVVEITINSGTDEVNLKVLEVSKAPNYTAISHVWSEGLGNSECNKIHGCQLRYVYSCLKALQRADKNLVKKFMTRVLDRSKQDSAPVYLWLDTFCAPVEPQYQQYRRRAIELMTETYSKARRVLVLDSDMRLASVKDERAGLLMRLYCSPWMRRLWTLNEAVQGARNLHVQLSDGALNLFDDVWKRAFNQAYSTRTGTVHGRYGMLKYFLKNPYEYEALVFLNRFTRLSDTREVPQHQRFAYAWDEVRWRSTSWKTDNTICFANILGLSPSLLLQTWDDSEPERLKKLFSLLDELPSTILFAPGPHMEEAGWTWAPAFLPKAYRSLTLELPRSYGNRSRTISVARRDHQGLWVKLSGFVLAPRMISLTLPFTMSYDVFRWRVEPQDPFPSSLHTQQIDVDDEDNNSSISLALILSDGLSADLWISGPKLAQARMSRAAVLVRIVDRGQDLMRCRYVCRVAVSLLVSATTPEMGPSTAVTHEAYQQGFQANDCDRVKPNETPVLIVPVGQEWCVQ